MSSNNILNQNNINIISSQQNSAHSSPFSLSTSSPFLNRIPVQPQSPHRSKQSSGGMEIARFSANHQQRSPCFGSSQHRSPRISKPLFFDAGNDSPIGNQQNQQPVGASSISGNVASLNAPQFSSPSSNSIGGSVNSSGANSVASPGNSAVSPPNASSSPRRQSMSSQSPSSSSRSPSALLSTPPSPSAFCSRFIPSRKHSPFQVPNSPQSPHHRRKTKRKLQFESVSDTMRRRPNLRDDNNLESSNSLIGDTADASGDPDQSTSRDAYDDMLRREFWPDQRVLRYETKRPMTSRILESPQKMLRERLAIHNGEENRASISKRKISTAPIKILDAPVLQDDFYLNLVDWGKSNILAVGLSDSVYLWNATTCKVLKLCTLPNNLITSVSWMQNGSSVAVGSAEGSVMLYDVGKLKHTKTLTGHTARVGCLAWNGNVIASGSRDRTILTRDIRVAQNMDPGILESAHSSGGPGTIKLSAHKQEVCGLKWSPDGKELASGGNDNKLFVWHPTQKRVPILKFSEHKAAVKGIAWSPHQHGLLASGGGTADRCIRFWNTSSGTALNHIDTGSQVCNIAWSENVNELVSTHGYSQNQIVVWKYPSMTSLATLTGHTFRVLYLSMSPDGTTLVSGAGDETLRLWNIFPPAKTSTTSSASGYNITCVR
uniref:CDC20/Fizzy WD40 domain-containing protein n=1 Tax=Percolomonas cosmopolitus TaxID=63605 RepID=A0A7S1KTC2_9EUKA|mmetsp:Transcript_8763/g.32400  ORF Transcript_8763/g.32400 Transcript_8763/m.32400 type:complete len:660 (+) Transcript_8763:488-2467(+)